MRFFTVFLIFISASFVCAQGESKCFKNDTLQGTNFVHYKIEGDRISGTYVVEITGDADSAKTYEFGGVKKGNLLTVKFIRDELPDVAPSSIESLVWTLEGTGVREILSIKYYGKNYGTNKYAYDSAEFEPCTKSYEELAKTASIVRFARGSNSASQPLVFKDISDRRAFSMTIRKGQTLDVGAAGCKLSIYLPSGELYRSVEWENASGSEKTYVTSAIDQMIIQRIPETGKYLVVLEKMAATAQPNSVRFKITN